MLLITDTDISDMLPENWGAVRGDLSTGNHHQKSHLPKGCTFLEEWDQSHLKGLRYVVFANGIVVGWLRYLLYQDDVLMQELQKLAFIIRGKGVGAKLL